MKAAHPHKLDCAGPLGTKLWKCSCGKWESEVPAKGPYGRTTMKARMAQLIMAHGKHKRAQQKKEMEANA